MLALFPTSTSWSIPVDLEWNSRVKLLFLKCIHSLALAYAKRKIQQEFFKRFWRNNQLPILYHFPWHIQTDMVEGRLITPGDRPIPTVVVEDVQSFFQEHQYLEV